MTVQEQFVELGIELMVHPYVPKGQIIIVWEKNQGAALEETLKEDASKVGAYIIYGLSDSDPS